MCQPDRMCNLYSITTNVEAIRRLFAVDRMGSSVGNLPAQPAIFPAYDAPVIRQVDGERELSMMHWGFILPQRDKAPKVVNNTRDDKATTLKVLEIVIRGTPVPDTCQQLRGVSSNEQRQERSQDGCMVCDQRR